ncbi:MAG: ribosome maturation factor RimM [Lachnospiraceae bacterium]|nr:ribosome maturation factor RimM [Lachnospiraceae bacterium]
MLKEFEVGVITSFHGLKGETKVFPTTDDASRFRKIKKVHLDNGTELEIESVRYFKGRPIIKFRGYDRLEDVEKFKGKSLFVDRSDADPLRKGEVYIAEILGADVFDEQNAHYGVLKDVLKTGANDVLVITKDDGTEKLLPVIPDCVLLMDAENHKVIVREMREI